MGSWIRTWLGLGTRLGLGMGSVGSVLGLAFVLSLCILPMVGVLRRSPGLYLSQSVDKTIASVKTNQGFSWFSWDARFFLEPDCVPTALANNT
jgi:hypothetical protein